MSEQVLQNPDRMSIEICRISEPYVNCNINGGDSGAYYFILTNPHYMYNFKGEPIFEIEKADPEFYQTIFDKYADKIDGTKNIKPIVLRDFYTDTYFNGVFDNTKSQFTDDYPLTPTQKTSLEGFMRTHNRPMPDFIPDAQVVFDPSSEKGIQMETAPYHVNLYRKSGYMLGASTEVPELTYGTGATMYKYIPNITKLMQHILGGGKTEFELGSYKLAIELFQDALSIDPNWEPAINGLNQAKKSYADKLFQESLSKGYRSLNDESFDDAKILFEQALSIRPNSKEALQALDELNLKRIASLTKSLKYKGLIAEVNEEWNQAKGFYEEILVIDPNLEEVKESLNRVESRILLDAEMTSIIARSDAYNDNKVLGQAQALLETAKSIERIGPKLEQSIQKLDSLIRIALIPIDVIFESDQLTEVTIFKVDQMGMFQQKIVSLRPGIYTARGSRKGFKDETIRFRVDPNKQNQRVRIICNKKI